VSRGDNTLGDELAGWLLQGFHETVIGNVYEHFEDTVVLESKPMDREGIQKLVGEDTAD
jgi:hypothetical protein